MAIILCVDDEPIMGRSTRKALEHLGHRVIAVASAPDALGVLQSDTVDLIVLDNQLPGISGIEFLQRLQDGGARIPAIMLTAQPKVEHAVAAMKAGALDYVSRPISTDQLRLVVDQALEYTALRRETSQLREQAQRHREERIVGAGPAMRHLMQRVQMVARSRATVLIQGESGTGKELIARAVHENSERRDAPFITLNCAALPEALVESMLFGHEKGAFTGALRQSKGAFERAHRGTLLLDEVSEMRLDLQAKLLRVLQEMEFERVGGGSLIRVDVRVIATTNRNLPAEVKAGRFREDLYYRLNVVPVHTPPLRTRLEDLPSLVEYFAARAARDSGRPIESIATDAMQMLYAYSWPGNVRELAHAVERAVILSPGPVIRADAFDLPHEPGAQAHLVEGHPGGGLRIHSLNIAEAEQRLIEEALSATGHNRTRAADLLGISVRTLRNKLNRPAEVEN